MARGWESKSVESQIEDAATDQDRRPDRVELLTPEQRKIRQQLQSLEGSRRRVLQEIETTRWPARRTALEQALAFLDEEIQKLTPR